MVHPHAHLRKNAILENDIAEDLCTFGFPRRPYKVGIFHVRRGEGVIIWYQQVVLLLRIKDQQLGVLAEYLGCFFGSGFARYLPEPAWDCTDICHEKYSVGCGLVLR